MLALVCLIDLDRVTIDEFIEKENMPCSYMTVQSKNPNEGRNAEKRRTVCLKKISGLLHLGAWPAPLLFNLHNQIVVTALWLVTFMRSCENRNWHASKIFLIEISFREDILALIKYWNINRREEKSARIKECGIN